MKKYLLFPLVFFALAHLSFISPNAGLPLSAIKVKAQKGPVTTFTENMIIPISLEVDIPCANGGAGDVVRFEGELHDLFHVTINQNSAMFKFHDNPQGLSATGLFSGVKYQATGVTQRQFKISASNGVYEETFINNFRIIGQGPGNNFIVHETYHVTFNANGILTAEVDNFTVECK